jgi:hypothetical protein
MADSLEELLQKQKEKHEKARQDALRQFKGKQLEDVLKKLDALQKPLEETERKYKKAKSFHHVSARQVIPLILTFIVIVIVAVIGDRCFESVLYFNEKMNWTVFHVLCPLGAFLFLFLGIYFIPRASGARMTYDLKTGKRVPYPRYLVVISLFLFGLMLPLGLYFPVSVAMNFMNAQPVKLDSTLVEIKNHKTKHSESSYYLDCKVLAYQTEDEPPSEETIVMPLDQLKMPLKDGDKIILTGRKSFAGVVIDGIEKAP